MNNFLERLKEELDSTADWNKTVTVNRKDLEQLIKSFEQITSENDRTEWTVSSDKHQVNVFTFKTIKQPYKANTKE